MPMDPSPSQTVAYGTLIASATSAVITGIYSAFKGHGGILAASAALNTGITAATFFTIREYVVSPILATTFTNAPGKAPDYLNPNISGPIVWSEMRRKKLIDTVISGGAAGGMLNGWRRGSRGILPGITTGSLACTFLQWAYNEVCIARIKYILSQPLRDSPFLRADRPSQRYSVGVVKERVMALLGVRRLKDEEYLEKLKSERDVYLKRIEKLEQDRPNSAGKEG